MDEAECHQIMKENYPEHGTDYVKLFKVVKSISESIGLEKALEILGKLHDERVKEWTEKNLNKFERSDDVIDDVIRIFYGACIGVEIGRDGKIVEKTSKKLVTRWWNQCPILEACVANGLDTRMVCKKAFHTPNQNFLTSLNGKLKFERNYKSGIRPHAKYCEEIITLEK